MRGHHGFDVRFVAFDVGEKGICDNFEDGSLTILDPQWGESLSRRHYEQVSIIALTSFCPVTCWCTRRMTFDLLLRIIVLHERDDISIVNKVESIFEDDLCVD